MNQCLDWVQHIMLKEPSLSSTTLVPVSVCWVCIEQMLVGFQDTQEGSTIWTTKHHCNYSAKYCNWYLDWYAHSFPSAEAKSKGSVTNGDKSYQLTLNSECNTDFLAQKQSPTPTHAYMNTSYSQCSMFLTVAVFSLESLESLECRWIHICCIQFIFPLYFSTS